MIWWQYVLDFFGGDNPSWIKKGAKLRSYSRRYAEIDEIIIHESVTSTTAKAVKVLNARKLGVHYCIDRDEAGTITSHVPAKKACSHAGSGHNRRSIGIEIVNPFYAKYAKDGDKTLTGVWVHRKEYLLPYESQMKSLWKLVLWLIMRHDVPLEFPGIPDGVMRWGKIAEHRKAGLKAHHRFAHGDGTFPECYLWYRTQALSHEEAWAKTIAAASAGKRSTPLLDEELA
jgi:hypothetical protein